MDYSGNPPQKYIEKTGPLTQIENKLKLQAVVMVADPALATFLEGTRFI